MNPVFVLVTAARNEEAYIEKTIKAVVSQTVKPIKWVIVSDGSTDRTGEIVNKYSSEYSFIYFLNLKGDMNRNFGSKVRAINKGLKMLKNINFEFIGNIDADVEFESDYFERIFERFKDNVNLGIAGGWIYEFRSGKYRSRSGNLTRSVPGSIQMFNRECFEMIGGYLPLKTGGEDCIAELKARMHGWETKTFPDLNVFHQRITGTERRNILFAIYHQGAVDYTLGYHPLFEALKCLNKIKEQPLVIGSLFRILGYLGGFLCRKPIPVPKDVVQYLRREQMMRVKSLLNL